MPQRRAWNQQQDEILRSLKQDRKEIKWSTIARIMQTQYNILGRTGKQCRERYYNFIDSSINREQWTPQEQKMLFDLHNQFGNKWALISKKMIGRSDNCVKNHFYSKLRKALRRINKIVQITLKKEYKQIKSQIIYKILQISQSKYKISSKVNQQQQSFCSQLINKLFQFDIQSHILSNNDELQAETMYRDMIQFQKGLKKKKKKLYLQPSDDFFLHPKSCLKVRRSSSNNSQYDSQNSDVFSSESGNFLDSSFDSNSFISDVSSQIRIKTQDVEQQNSTMIKDSQTTKKSLGNKLYENNRNTDAFKNVLTLPTVNFLTLSNKSVRSEQFHMKLSNNQAKSQQNYKQFELYPHNLYASQQKAFYLNKTSQKILYPYRNTPNSPPQIQVKIQQCDRPEQNMDEQFYLQDQYHLLNTQKCAYFQDIKIQMRIISPKISSNSSMSFDDNKDFYI